MIAKKFSCCCHLGLNPVASRVVLLYLVNCVEKNCFVVKHNRHNDLTQSYQTFKRPLAAERITENKTINVMEH